LFSPSSSASTGWARRRTRNGQPDVQPLRHGDGKAPARHRHGAESVDRDQLPIERAEIDMKSAHRGAVDDAQQHPPARLDLDHRGIGERAVVGEEGIIFHIVQIRFVNCHSRSHCRAGSPHSLHCRRTGRCCAAHGWHAALLEFRENLLGRREAEVGQHDDDFLLVRAVALIVDDQRCRHQELLLKPLMGMHPESAAEA
jgi:hypothetical protein